MADFRPLTLKQALDLYKILSPHIPEKGIDMTYGLFMQGMVASMREKEPKAYLRVLELLTGKTYKDFMYNYTPKELLQIFVVGLSENDVIELIRFAQRIGLKNG